MQHLFFKKQKRDIYRSWGVFKNFCCTYAICLYLLTILPHFSEMFILCLSRVSSCTIAVACDVIIKKVLSFAF